MKIEQKDNQIILTITDSHIKYWLYDIVDHKLEEKKITDSQVKSFFKKYKAELLKIILKDLKRVCNNNEYVQEAGYEDMLDFIFEKGFEDSK